MNIERLYLRAIELHIADSFPGRKVRVIAEESPFRNGFIEVKALVDIYGAYVTLDPNIPCNEWYVSDILVAKLKEVIDAREGGDSPCTT